MEHRDTGMPHQQKLLCVSIWQDYSMHNLCVRFLVSLYFFSSCNNSMKTGKKENKPLYREQGENRVH